MSKESKNIQLRHDIKKLLDDLGLQYGWRQHFANVLDVHPSTINNAVNGHRTGPKENQILIQLHKYLLGLYRYSQKRASVNTKVS